MVLRIRGSSKTELLAKICAYSAIYGAFHVNYIDLVTPGSNIPGYHLWLAVAYFAPFIPILLLLGFDDWELLLSMGFLASLMNDLLYCPVGMLLFGRRVDLAEWYLWQLGFRGLDAKWTFNGGFFSLPVSSALMGASIYARATATYLLCRRWWRERASQSLNPEGSRDRARVAQPSTLPVNGLHSVEPAIWLEAFVELNRLSDSARVFSNYSPIPIPIQTPSSFNRTHSSADGPH